MLSRREALIRIGSAAGVAALTPRSAGAQGAAKPEPPSVVSNPPRDFASPVTYPDPDIIALDNRFRRYIVGNTVMKRLHTGTRTRPGRPFGVQPALINFFEQAG